MWIEVSDSQIVRLSDPRKSLEEQEEGCLIEYLVGREVLDGVVLDFKDKSEVGWCVSRSNFIVHKNLCTTNKSLNDSISFNPTLVFTKKNTVRLFVLTLVRNLTMNFGHVSKT